MPKRQALRILLVEDDAIHARIMRSALAANGTRTELSHMRDGESAVSFLTGLRGGSGDARQTGLPDLLLLDIRLPRIDGFDVLQAIRADERLRHLPVIIISTSDRAEDVMRSYRLGANAFLCKSPDLDVFSDRLSALCRFWRCMELPGHAAC